MRERLTRAPRSITTRPMSSVASSTVPCWSASALSSTMRLTSSMSATLPVSFQYPVMIVDRTLWPVSSSHCRASVISSSPRPDGLSWLTASCTAGVKM